MGNTALITGATGGLGYAYARYLAREGYDLILTGRREAVYQRAQALRQEFGVAVEVLRPQLGRPEGVEELLSALEGREIEVLVNNAGFGYAGKLVDMPPQQLEEMLCLHVLCTTRLCRAVGAAMAERGRGTIINIASAAAFAPAPNSAVYAASKRYILQLSETLHVEMARWGVRVQAVCPGMVETDFHRRMGVERAANWRSLLPFRRPGDVVADAMGDLKRGRVVSVPDAGGRLLRQVDRHLPRGLFYRILALADRKLLGKSRP